MVVRIERDKGGHEVCDFNEARRRGRGGCSRSDPSSCSGGAASSSVTAAEASKPRPSSSSTGGGAVNEYKDNSWRSVIVRI